MVMPSSRCRRLSSLRISSRSRASRLDSGSSRSSNCGSTTIDRAKATRCCWPPDSALGRRWAKPVKPTLASAAPTLAAISFSGSFFSRRPKATFSATGQMREQGVGLEHQPDAALVGRHPGDVAPGQGDPPAGRRHQPGDGAHRRGLAAAGGAEQRHQLAAPDRHGQPVDRDLAVIGERQPVEVEEGVRHSGTAPAGVRRPARWRATSAPAGPTGRPPTGRS